MDTVALTLRLPVEIHEALRQEAFDKRVSLTSLIVDALGRRGENQETQWEYGVRFEDGSIVGPWPKFDGTIDFAKSADLTPIRRRPAGPWEVAP